MKDGWNFLAKSVHLDEKFLPHREDNMHPRHFVVVKSADISNKFATLRPVHLQNVNEELLELIEEDHDRSSKLFSDVFEVLGKAISFRRFQIGARK
jgi:hypothetical protein